LRTGRPSAQAAVGTMNVARRAAMQNLSFIPPGTRSGRHEVPGRFDCELTAWLASSAGRFAVFCAERERRLGA
jgi:hypothetical protein